MSPFVYGAVMFALGFIAGCGLFYAACAWARWSDLP